MKRAGWLSFALSSVLGASACAGPAPQDGAGLPVIVGFVEATATADPATLAALAQASGAQVRFVAAVSPRSAAYRLDCPGRDPQCAGAVAALRALPSIRYLDIDQKKGFR